MKPDIIIIAASKNRQLRDITQYAVDTCNLTCDANIYVIETHKRHEYKGCVVLEYIQKEFNYNRTINFALNNTKGEVVGFFNNDIEFTAGWLNPVLDALKIYNSVSPRCNYFNKPSNGLKEGYKLRVHLNGWAIVINRSILKKIQKFDESVKFWRSDDLYAQQLKKHNIKHALVSESIVNHIHKGSATLNTLTSKEREEMTHGQYNIYKDLDVHKYTFSIIMPSYLGYYKGAAENRGEKFKRALNSVLESTFKDYEIIIISDGCDETVDLYYKYYSGFKNIKCYKIPKQKTFSGNVRQIGLERATGKYIIYLDSDDMYRNYHLEFVNKNMNGQDWAYFDDIFYNGEDQQQVKKVHLTYGIAGTSSICHKRLLDVSWSGCNGYGHDFRFIEKLMKYKGKHIGTGGYLICHTPSNFDYNG